MNVHLFDLDFGRWDALFLFTVPALFTFLLFLYSARYFNNSRLNFFFSLLLVISAGWQFAEGGIHLSTSVEQAAAWSGVSLVLGLFVIVYGLLFMTRFAGWKGRVHSIFMACGVVAPAFLFFFLIEAGMITEEIAPSETWYWTAKSGSGALQMVMLGWMAVCGLLVPVISWSQVFSRREPVEKKQALLLSVGITLPIFFGILMEVVLPVFISTHPLPLAVPCMSVFVVCSVIAVEKYHFLRFSPRSQWRQIMETVNDGILIVDNNEVITYVNYSFSMLCGYEVHELIGRNASTVLLDGDQKRRMADVMSQRRKKEGGSYEMEITTKTGQKKWVMINGLPYLDHKGNVAGSIGIQTDITKVKQHEQLLLHNEKRFKKAQAVAKLGSWELSFPVKTIVLSEEALRIYSIPASEGEVHSADKWLAYIHDDDRDMVEKSLEDLQNGAEGADLFHRICVPFGRAKYVRTVIARELDEDGKLKGLFGICHDITELRTMQSALEESEILRNTFIQESPLAILFVDPLTREKKFANPAFYSVTGFNKDAFQKDPNLFSGFLPAHEVLMEAINTGRDVKLEMEWINASGQPLKMLMTVVYKKVEAISRIYISAQDITDRMRAEESLREVNSELETFVYKASHDLRGPLASILGLVQVSKLEPADKAPAYLEMIERATGKLDTTLIQLTKAMKTKSAEGFSELINCEEVVRESLRKYHFYEGYKRLHVEVVVQGDTTLLSNKAVLETIIQNLIENAIKYQNKLSPRPMLRIVLSDLGNYFSFVFEDNGIGVAPELQDKVFDMYFRATDLSQGSGLGLYLVKKSVEVLKGAIALRSGTENGTIVTVTLPKKERQADGVKERAVILSGH